MASNKSVVPEAKEALNRFKMEAASEVGVNLKQGYNGDLTSKQAGSVGGQMVNVTRVLLTFSNAVSNSHDIFLCSTEKVNFNICDWT